MQPASSRPASSTTALPSRQVGIVDRPRVTTLPNHQKRACAVSCAVTGRSISHLDLLRALGLDPGTFATTCLDPAANSDASASQTPQIKTRRRETALVSFQDRNRDVPDPPPAEIHVDCGPAFAHGRHFALNQRESPAMRQGILRALGVEHLIIRIGP